MLISRTRIEAVIIHAVLPLSNTGAEVRIVSIMLDI